MSKNRAQIKLDISTLLLLRKNVIKEIQQQKNDILK